MRLYKIRLNSVGFDFGPVYFAVASSYQSAITMISIAAGVEQANIVSVSIESNAVYVEGDDKW